MCSSSIDGASLLAGTFGAAVPLIFAGLGELVAERTGVINLGVEGMMLVGAIAGFAAAAESGHGALAGRLKAAGAETFDQEATTCCYAQSDKSWVRDPAGVRWETFFTFGEATSYGEDEVLPEPFSCSAWPAQA